MAIRAAAAASFALSSSPLSSVSPNSFPSHSVSPTPHPLSSPILLANSRRSSRVHAFPSSELTLEELNPSVDLLRKTAEAVGDFRKTSIFIVGMDCTVKRNVGKLLANSIIYRYLNSDDLLEEVLGGKAALKSFLESDEKSYREAETEALKQLTSMGSLVLCAGDGAVLSSTNLGLLRHGVSIFIDVPLEIVANDLLKTEGAEAVSDSGSFSEVLDKLRKQYDELKERYGTADAVISVRNVASRLGYESLDSLTLEDMVLEVVRQIERLIRTKTMMEAAARPF